MRDKLLKFGNSILKKMTALKTLCCIRPHTDPLMTPFVHQWPHPSLFLTRWVWAEDTYLSKRGLWFNTDLSMVLDIKRFSGSSFGVLRVVHCRLSYQFISAHPTVTVIEKVGVTNNVCWLNRKLQLDMSGPSETQQNCPIKLNWLCFVWMILRNLRLNWLQLTIVLAVDYSIFYSGE